MDRTYTVFELRSALDNALVDKPERNNYRVLLCADNVIGPSPWSDNFRLEVDDTTSVVCITTERLV